jgi:flavodoxin
MNSVVIYGSRHGNTRKLAEAIAGELRKHGAAQLVSAEKATTNLIEQTDLVVVGGPTEAHRMTEPVAQLFDRIGKSLLAGKGVALVLRLGAFAHGRRTLLTRACRPFSAGRPARVVKHQRSKGFVQQPSTAQQTSRLEDKFPRPK